jgi:DNA-binding LacI/PurR family transcriptional regulator
VARHAGVSRQTVSRVINGSERVAPETLARVTASIEELQFRPNAIARSMAVGRTRSLTCLAPNLTDYTFASIIEGAVSEAWRHGYLLYCSPAPGESEFATLVEHLTKSGRTDGLMVINPYMDGRHRLLPEGFPVMFVGARPRAEAASSVALDDEDAGRTATGHLLAIGRTRIAMITGPPAEDCVTDRQVGYRAALSAAGIPFVPDLILEGDWSAESGHDRFMELARRPNPPDAVFAQNDRMAIGVLRAARKLGIRVPEDLAVIGVDGMPLSAYFDPPLSTMRQDMFGMGQQAAQLLIRGLDDPSQPSVHLQLRAELVVRQSTRPDEPSST